MLALLFVVGALLGQGVPVLPNQGGTVSGVLRTATGAPAAGVRVAALARPEALQDLASSSSFAGLVETDAQGRYRIENISPGRYYVVAGRVDVPTYYPGTLQATDGTVVLITPGITVSSIDFVLNNASAGRALDSRGSGWVIPLQVRMENGGKVPVSAGGRFPVLRFTRVGSSAVDAPLNAPSLTISNLLSSIVGSLANVTPPIPQYRVSVENLPEGYGVKSLVFGSVDLKVSPLQLPPSSATALVPLGQSVSAVLTSPSPLPGSGARVAGRIRGDVKRTIYISGKPGAVYADGAFEFTGVPPGRHTIVTLDNPGGSPFGANLVVGDRDLLDVDLEEIAVAPAGSDRPAPPAPAGQRTPGTRIPLASIRGRVLDAETREPFNAGRVGVNGDYSANITFDDDGRFEIRKLLPGTYVLEVTAFGIGTVSRTVVIDEQGATVELTIGP